MISPSRWKLKCKFFLLVTWQQGPKVTWFGGRGSSPLSHYLAKFAGPRYYGKVPGAIPRQHFLYRYNKLRLPFFNVNFRLIDNNNNPRSILRGILRRVPGAEGFSEAFHVPRSSFLHSLFRILKMTKSWGTFSLVILTMT